jgi:hypothetical protein
VEQAPERQVQQGGNMSDENGFGELIAWQKSRALTKEIYNVTQMDGFAKDLL